MKIITVAGMICSGKSFIAEKASQALGVPHTTFSQYIKAYCLQNKFPVDRKTLQDVGKQFIDSSPENFLHSVVNSCIDAVEELQGIIIDGIRHKSMLAIIKNTYPGSILLYIDVPIEIRYNRYLKRKREGDIDYSLEGFQDYNSHPVEQEIESLKPLADLIITPQNEYTFIEQLKQMISL